MIEVAVARHGCRAVVIDPWNKLESDKPAGKRETEWIGECLDTLMDLARGYSIHVQILAHPAKPEDMKSRKIAPDTYSISGSAHWFNKIDQAFCIWRPKIFGESGERMTEATFYHQKARFDELGYPCQLGLRYGLSTGRFKSTDFETVPGL